MTRCSVNRRGLVFAKTLRSDDLYSCFLPKGNDTIDCTHGTGIQKRFVNFLSRNIAEMLGHDDLPELVTYHHFAKTFDRVSARLSASLAEK